MKYLIILLLFFSVSTAQSELARQIKWQKVIGWKNKELDAYIDLKSIEKIQVKNGEIAKGTFLLQRKNPSILVQPGTQPIHVSSLARIVLIDCKKNLSVIAADFFFNLEKRLPAITDMPVLTNDYREDDDAEITEISAEDVFYKTLCPNYI